MKKLLLLALIAVLAACFFIFDLGQYLSLEFIKSQQQTINEYYQQHTVITLLAYFALYVLVTALSLPGAAVMTLAAGAIFGLLSGVIMVSFASTIGATCAFLV